MAFADNVKALIQRKKIPFAHVAKAAGMSKQGLYHTLRYNNPTLNTLKRIAKALQVDVKDLLQ